MKIFEILLRLPVKTLLKTKCVSKSWLSHISSPQFITTHLKLSANNQELSNHSLLFSNSDEIKNDVLTFCTCSLYSIMYQESLVIPIELDFSGELPFDYDYRIFGSCNELFCISNDDYEDLFLWNPSIRELKKLPCSGIDVGELDFLEFPGVGFGYIECQNDYRIVEIVGGEHNKHGNQCYVSVYSSRTNSWKSIQDYPGVIFFTDSDKFVNGRLHWITFLDCGSDSNVHFLISSFNLLDETFGNLALPETVEESHDLALGTSRGYLYVSSGYGTKTDVGSMKEYGLARSWTKLVSCTSNKVFRPIFISQDDKILLQLGTSLVCFNSRDNTIRLPGNQMRCSNDIDSTFSLYIESLVSPNSLEDV